jgi:hypothetical protein
VIAALPARHIALLFVVLAGALSCRDDANSASTPRSASATTATKEKSLVPPAEVVIAKPAQPYVAAAVANPGTLTGTITVTSPLQPTAPIPTGRDSALCGASIPDESVSQQGGGLGGVVIWLDGVHRGKPLPLERRLELESDHCRLTPRVQAAVVTSAVNVIGHDVFRQHLRFLAGGETEPRAAILMGRDEQVIPTELPFKAPGLVVVRDLDHPWPKAYVLVFDHPYFAVTAPNGTFTIDGVPPGKYTAKAWHERTKIGAQVVEITAGATAKVAMALQGK